MSESKNYGTFTKWNTTEQKEGTPTLCDSMDGTGEHYASEISQAMKDKYHTISSIRGT